MTDLRIGLSLGSVGGGFNLDPDAATTNYRRIIEVFGRG